MPLSRRVVGRHLPTSHERARGPGYPESAPPASRLKLTSAVSSSHAATLGRGGQDWTAGRMRKGRVSAPELQRKMGPSPILEPRHKPTGPPQPLQNPHSEFIRSIDRCACAHWCPTLCDPMDCSPPWNFHFPHQYNKGDVAYLAGQLWRLEQLNADRKSFLPSPVC